MEKAKAAVLQKSAEIDLEVPISGKVTSSFTETIDSYATMGFQATNLSRAINIFSEVMEVNQSDTERKITVYLSMPYSPIWTPVRNCVALLASRKLLQVLVFTGGVVEADVAQIFSRDHDEQLKHFRQWFDEHLTATLTDPLYTPSQFCLIIGKELVRQVDEGFLDRTKAEQSITYWAAKQDIPIYVPSWADGTLAEMLIEQAFVVDLVRDIVALNKFTMHAEETAMIIIGGGVAKHHTCNANLMRNGADFAIYLSISEEYDGSDGGASPEEAISWGKIKATAKHVKVHADASLTLPIIVSRCVGHL